MNFVIAVARNQFSMNLDLLVSPEPNKNLIIEAKALCPLIALLSVDNADVQCNACGCITTLATVGELGGWSRREEF